MTVGPSLEALRAIDEARDARRKIEATQPAIDKVTDELRAELEVEHFVPLIEQLVLRAAFLSPRRVAS